MKIVIVKIVVTNLEIKIWSKVLERQFVHEIQKLSNQKLKNKDLISFLKIKVLTQRVILEIWKMVKKWRRRKY